MNDNDRDNLQEDLAALMLAYDYLKAKIRRLDPHLFERWKAGGCMVDDSFVGMYPDITKVVEILQDQDTDEMNEEQD